MYTDSEAINMQTQNYTGLWDSRNLITTVKKECYAVCAVIPLQGLLAATNSFNIVWKSVIIFVFSTLNPNIISVNLNVP